jgi:hypothetical protein
MLDKRFRLLARDRTMLPDEWYDRCEDQTAVHHFPTPDDLQAFITQVQAEGWVLINSSALPQAAAGPQDTSTEYWIFRRD